MYIHSHFETRDVNTLIIIFFKSKKSVIVVVFIGLNTIWLHRSIKRNNNNNNNMKKKYNSFKHKDKEKIINYLKHIRDVLQMISFL